MISLLFAFMISLSIRKLQRIFIPSTLEVGCIHRAFLLYNHYNTIHDYNYPLFYYTQFYFLKDFLFESIIIRR